MRTVLRSVLAALLLLLFAVPNAGAGALQPAAPWQPPRMIEAASGGADIPALVRHAMDLSDAGRIAEADAALDQAIALNDRRGARGRAFDPVLRGMKARLLMQAGQFDAAETALKQLLVTAEAGGRRNIDLTTMLLGTLSELYMRQGRFKEAEPLLQRSVALAERSAGKNSPVAAEQMNTLAVFYMRTGQTAKAIPLLEKILPIFSRGRTPDDRMSTSDVLVNLGAAYQFSGDNEKALQNFRSAYEADVKLYGPDHPSTILALANAGVLLGVMGRFDEAAPALHTALDATKSRYGADNPKTAHAENNLGWVELSRDHPAEALALFRPALATYLAHRALQKAAPTARGAAVDEREVARTILGLMRAASSVIPTDAGMAAALMDEAFQAAQQVHRGKAAEALALTTARFAAGSGALAALIRERQDLSAEHAKLEDALTAAFGADDRRRDKAREAAGRDELAAMAARITAISAELAERFPDYIRLADPAPLSVAEAQRLLAPDQALVLLAPFGGANGEASFTFVVTHDEARWQGGPTGATELTRMVRGLRCGLDVGQWGSKDGAELCEKLLGRGRDGEDLPFDAGLANQLFETLFGPLTSMLSGRTLLVVAPDPLASLPLQVLVTAPPADAHPSGAAFRDVPFLVRSNAVAVLPSAAALRSATTPAATAPEPYIGFGDPTLVGGLDCADPAVPSACPVLATAATPALVAAGAARTDTVFRGGLADVEAVRALCPLPETALELRCVADSVQASAADIHVGDAATVPAVLAADLQRYRIVHFATHGLLAGEMASADGTVSEPALVMTPPETPSAENDGLLRASTIATLKLDADWVILSACNTAAGSTLGGEAMSGLASAFLYSGARSLLVSHWPVATDAAVLITTTAFAAMRSDPALGRAEAIRRAMLALIDAPSGAYAHPALWAPFAVVGASGPARL